MSGIEWTDETWNPVRGCRRVSPGCENCYAEAVSARFAEEWAGPPTLYGDTPDSDTHFAEMTESGPRWTGRVQLIPWKLDEPLRWRKPRRVFVNSMSDLFHEALPDEAIDRVFAVMMCARQHTFQVLTKRPERMRDYLSNTERLRSGVAEGMKAITTPIPLDALAGAPWPLENVWLGVSVEDQKTADERIPLLRQTPAAVRFVSVEPMLEQIDLCLTPGSEISGEDGARRGIHWVIVGGESGHHARPMDVAWPRSAIQQCREAGVPAFFKQWGSKPFDSENRCNAHIGIRKSKKGGDPAEWPEDLRVRGWPR